MKSRVTHIKLAVLLCACLGVAALMLGQFSRSASAQAQAEQLSEAEQRGKQIYLRGESAGGPEITVMLGGGDTEVPATTFACANCHGLMGEGTTEGGLPSPPLVWPALTSSHTSVLTTNERGAYTPSTLVRAVRLGLDRWRRGLFRGRD